MSNATLVRKWVNILHPTVLKLYFFVLTVLGVIAVTGMTGILVYGWSGKEPPSSVVTISATCVGSLGSFLIAAPSHRRRYRQEGNDRRKAL